MTRYEEELERIFGKVGVNEAYLDLRSKIFDAIAEAYPDLADECHRQDYEGFSRTIDR